MRISFCQAGRNSFVVFGENRKLVNIHTHTHQLHIGYVCVASSSRMKYETNCSNFPEGDGHANVTNQSRIESRCRRSQEGVQPGAVLLLLQDMTSARSCGCGAAIYC